MDPYSLGPLNERHSQCWGMIQLKYKEYDTLRRTSFRSSEVI
ncbi:hypothetical protein Gotur_012100 [Gossypium turneri]